jgi:GWxTD domain-containing protein
MTHKTVKTLLVMSMAMFLAGCASTEKIALDPESRDFYETARLVMTEAERDIFNHLPDAESRREFVTDFWAKRDPDPDTENNEFKEEFEKRLDYANKHFREGKKGWNTDRGRIYVYLGSPEKTEEIFPQPTADLRGSVIYWIYYRYDLGIEFTDEKGVNSFTITQIVGDLFSAMEAAKLGAIFRGDGGDSKKFVNFGLAYERGKRQFVLSFPIKRLSFRDEQGLLKAEFEFEFFIYQPGAAQKRIFKESRTFAGRPEDLEKTKDISFIVPYDLGPGKNYVDVIVTGKDIGKTRKIFLVKN